MIFVNLAREFGAALPGLQVQEFENGCIEGVHSFVFACEAGVRPRRIVQIESDCFLIVCSLTGSMVSAGRGRLILANQNTFSILSGGPRRFKFSEEAQKFLVHAVHLNSAIGNLALLGTGEIRECSFNSHPEFPNLLQVRDKFLAGWDHPGFVSQMVVQSLRMASETEATLTMAPSKVGIPDTLKSLIENVRANPRQNWSILTASSITGYSQYHFSRTFKAQLGTGFHEFVDLVRLDTAIAILSESPRGLEQTAEEAGFSSVSVMREAFRKHIHLLPSDMINMHESRFVV